MDLFSIGVTLLVIFLLIVVVRSLTPRSGRGSGSFDGPPYDSAQNVAHPIHHVYPTDAGPAHQESGHLGSRDMGFDHHHDAGHTSEPGSDFSAGGDGQ